MEGLWIGDVEVNFPVPLDVKLEIILDSNNNQSKYFPGDAIHGKVFFTANQSHTLRNFRLAWTGRIHVQPIQSNKDGYTYFDECWKLGSTLTKSPIKAKKGASSVPCYTSQLILDAATSSEAPIVKLQKNKTVALAFTVHVPNDRPLPSCTESVGVSPNKIIYMLEAFVDKPLDENQKKFFAQRVVHVFERIFTRTLDMMTPQRAEQMFMVSLLTEELDFSSAMRVTLPCRGCVPGIAIPVSISIWNNVEFTRKQGISISLFRVNQVLANGRAYTSQGEKVHRVVADLNITDSDTNNNSQKVQTIRVGLPIPRGTMPTISLEQSQLLAISYFIRVQVFAQEGVYTTSDGKRSQFMMVDLPFIVGTLSTPSNSSNSPATTPMSSPKSTSSNAILYSNTPTSPPPTLYQHPARTSPRISSPPISSLPISSPPISSTPISSPPISSPPLVSTSSPQSTLSSNTGNERKSLIGGMFRKSSTGSQTSDKKRSGKKKSVFSSLRLYKSRKKNDQQEDDTLSVKQEDDALSVEQESSEVVLPPVDDNSTAVTVGGVFDIFARDDIDDFEEDPELQVEKQPVPAFSEMKKEESRVFKMFPDDDDDDESDYEPEVVQESISKRINRKEAVFKMFPEEADEDDDDSNEVIKDEQQQLLDEITDTIESFVIDRQPKKQSNVFQMFNDDSSEEEEEEEEVSQKQVKPNHDNQKYQKPNEFIIEYKPDTKDVLMNSTDDSDSEDDINDLLSVLAKREKLLSNQHMK